LRNADEGLLLAETNAVEAVGDIAKSLQDQKCE
jgi:hypothetical protein